MQTETPQGMGPRHRNGRPKGGLRIYLSSVRVWRELTGVRTLPPGEAKLPEISWEQTEARRRQDLGIVGLCSAVLVVGLGLTFFMPATFFGFKPTAKDPEPPKPKPASLQQFDQSTFEVDVDNHNPRTTTITIGQPKVNNPLKKGEKVATPTIYLGNKPADEAAKPKDDPFIKEDGTVQSLAIERSLFVGLLIFLLATLAESLRCLSSDPTKRPYPLTYLRRTSAVGAAGIVAVLSAALYAWIHLGHTFVLPQALMVGVLGVGAMNLVHTALYSQRMQQPDGGLNSLFDMHSMGLLTGAGLAAGAVALAVHVGTPVQTAPEVVSTPVRTVNTRPASDPALVDAINRLDADLPGVVPPAPQETPPSTTTGGGDGSTTNGGSPGQGTTTGSGGGDPRGGGSKTETEVRYRNRTQERKKELVATDTRLVGQAKRINDIRDQLRQAVQDYKLADERATTSLNAWKAGQVSAEALQRDQGRRATALARRNGLKDQYWGLLQTAKSTERGTEQLDLAQQGDLNELAQDPATKDTLAAEWGALLAQFATRWKPLDDAMAYFEAGDLDHAIAVTFPDSPIPQPA